MCHDLQSLKTAPLLCGLLFQSLCRLECLPQSFWNRSADHPHGACHGRCIEDCFDRAATFSLSNGITHDLFHDLVWSPLRPAHMRLSESSHSRLVRTQRCRATRVCKDLPVASQDSILAVRLGSTQWRHLNKREKNSVDCNVREGGLTRLIGGWGVGLGVGGHVALSESARGSGASDWPHLAMLGGAASL